MNKKPFISNSHIVWTIAVISLFSVPGAVPARDLSLPVTGEVLGTVVDATGVPQMGAAVVLFNKYRQLVSHAATDPSGRFAFSGLAAGMYSIRVSVPSFLPAARDQILVKAGLDSILQIHLATLLSSIEVNYRAPSGAMSDDWKWVLRSSPSTRMIMRDLPQDLGLDDPAAGEPAMKPRVFSGTHAVMAVSGGDGGLIDSDQLGADVGTTFAVSTNVLGKNQLQLAGSLGQNAEYGPAALALCAIYSRTPDNPFTAPPEVTFTVAQVGGIAGPLAGGSGLPGTQPAGVPVLHTLSLGLYQVANILDNLRLEYGGTEESVEFGQHASRLSPFARITADLGRAGSVLLVYSDGGRPDELLAHQQYQQAAALDEQRDDLSAPLDSLSRLPQISDRNERLELERTQNYELGYSKTEGSRTYSASGFYERVSNGRLRVAGDTSSLNAGDLFTDGISTTSIYNIGRYDRAGLLLSMDQRVSQALDLTFAYGRLGGFGVAGDPTDGVRGFLDQRLSNVASVSTRALVPHAHTRIQAGYGWIDARTVAPYHAFTTQNVTALPGFNILVRQPLPSFPGMPGHFELTADLRNLLAQGYTPLNAGDGGRLLLVESPRAIRGGVKFTF